MKKKAPAGYWHTPPEPFNQEARPGLGQAVSKAYEQWCEANEGSTQQERKDKYRWIYESLRSSYPSYAEMRRT